MLNVELFLIYKYFLMNKYIMFEDDSPVIQYNDKDYNTEGKYFKADDDELLIIMLYAPYCHFCQEKKDRWNKLGEIINKDYKGDKCKIVAVDVDKNKVIGADLNIQSIPKFMLQYNKKGRILSEKEQENIISDILTNL